MTKFKIEGLLAAMVGKQYSYKLKEHRVLRYTVDEGAFKVVTDKADLEIKTEDAKEFFNDCLFIEESMPFVPKEPATIGNGLRVFAEPKKEVVLPKTMLTSNAEKLAEILFNNIQKVQEDPEFIAQAQSIVASTKLFIDLAKVEVELIKAVSR